MKTGFTLIEMAVVLIIIALLLATGLALLEAEQEQRRIEETDNRLNDAREMLIGYALSHVASHDSRPYLPCPDAMMGSSLSSGNIANDGKEDRNPSTGACDVQEGNLPWATLGLTPRTDAWANRFRYRVSGNFSNSAYGLQLSYSGDINIYDASSEGSGIALGVPAVIVSHGKNGKGAINATGNANPAPSGINELANSDVTVNFVSRAPAGNGAAGGYFDDQLTWLSQYVLYNRLVQGGRLP
jgi:prepilin-type N-terminal cleavage/methylation domain-containing protein